MTEHNPGVEVPTPAHAGAVVLSIGANLGDPVAALAGVVEALSDQVRCVSRLYRSQPWGGVEQAEFYNACLIITDPESDPPALLAHVQALEADAGRERDIRWGPRTLDVDLIAVYDAAGQPVISADPQLTLPHPRAHLRAFVLIPWLDCDPAAELSGHPLHEYLVTLPEEERAGIIPVNDDPRWPYGGRPVEGTDAD